jgi:ribosomal 50S subunit-recycling heat shock protein
VRLDVWLKKVCLLKSRSQAKSGCQSGKILLDDRKVKESHTVHPGERITLVFPHRQLEIQVIDLPEGNVSRKNAPHYYRILVDEKRGPEIL